MKYCEKHEVYDRCDEPSPRPRPASTHLSEAARGGRFRRMDDVNVVEAQYEGTCTECQGDILIGDLILPDEERRPLPGGTFVSVKFGWKHRECP